MIKFKIMSTNNSLPLSREEATQPKYTLFVGNPGHGKSTLLNGIVQDLAFESGVSICSAMTKEVKWREHPEGSMNYYGDTPGLNDVSIEASKKAAAQIETGLKKQGLY